MRDHVSLGCSPSGEDCAQVGSPDYHERLRRETRAYIGQLLRQTGEPPPGASLRVKAFPHDFGSYHEVCACFDDQDEAATGWAYDLENRAPETWDDQARAELAAAPAAQAVA